MSTDTREVIEVGDQTKVETRSEKKARIARVLDRGASGERLNVQLPAHLHGEWVPHDEVSIFEKERLGFRIDTEFAPKRALHSKGDGKSLVGDCVFMVCAKEDKEIIDEIRNDQYLKLNRKGKVQKEESDFNSLTQKEGLEPLTEGSVNTARKDELQAAMGIPSEPINTN
jgi:hypothetical protein